MADSRATLNAFIDSNIDTNGTNAITGAQMNTILKDIVASCLNLVDDSTSLADDIYRTALVTVVKDVEFQVTFSTELSVSDYQVVMNDPNGIGWGDINDLQTTGFKFTPLASGDITYLVMLNN